MGGEKEEKVKRKLSKKMCGVRQQEDRQRQGWEVRADR